MVVKSRKTTISAHWSRGSPARLICTYDAASSLSVEARRARSLGLLNVGLASTLLLRTRRDNKVEYRYQLLYSRQSARSAVKTEDRIARDAIHQNIIISELLKHKKRIIIHGKDDEENPENKFALTVFGAVAEFERAKIIERMMRGKMHRLRMGQLPSQGHVIYGYTYIKKTGTAPPALVVNEEQSAVVRSIFEMYANGEFSTAAISRVLEERGVPPYTGGPPVGSRQDRENAQKSHLHGNALL
jgi:DNA invertase Pin-like site-specific DNA recombinase